MWRKGSLALTSLFVALIGCALGVRPARATEVQVYGEDFQSERSLPEWFNARRDTTPNGQRFLGRYANDVTRLTLTNLPPHTRVHITFDLYIIQSWDGNDTGAGPDYWNLQLLDGPVLQSTTTFSNWPTLRQAYPLAYPGGDYPAKTGADTTRSLGYTYPTLPNADSVYPLSYTVDHTDPDITFSFSAGNLQGIDDESWGLDNVRVWVLPDTTPPTFTSPVTGSDGSGHKTVALSVQDTGSGLSTVKVVKAANCTLTIAGQPVAVGASHDFSITQPTSPQPIVATKINQSAAASFTLQATDVCRNIATFDPVVLSMKIPRDASTVSRRLALSAADHYLSVSNVSPGVRRLSTYVNGTALRLSLEGGSSASADLSPLLRPGSNAVLLVATGEPGSSVTVLLGDTPGLSADSSGTSSVKLPGTAGWSW